MTREEAIAILNHNVSACLHGTEWGKALDMAIKALEQEPRKGHWKAFIHNAYHGTDEDGEPIWREVTAYHCSQCNRRTVIKEKYCPNCGADMREMSERKALRPIEGNNDSYNCENYIP